MADGEAVTGMMGNDLWKWLLGAAVTVVLALAMFGLAQLAQANTQRLDRLERAEDTLAGQRQTDAGDIRELKANLSNIMWRLDKIDQKLDRALEVP